MLAALVSRTPDEVMVIDFQEIEFLDFSAADEFLTVLVRRVISGELGTRRFVLTNLSDAVRENVQAVLALRGLHCLERRADGSVTVLGRISPPLAQTLDHINRMGRTTSNEVAKMLGDIELNAAANRLKTLADAGLVVEDPTTSGGRGARRIFYSVMPVSAEAN
ncbi:MAG: hypothetical protein OEX18_12200 [Candidatus Krumholzibacteria bacterium]|nr:hypothetical protein [Candidatus Krumholzibacteria bacterium]MDH4338025.1 hypothetical protein [Candidatus Krumholzibacteria bacterium]MDH5269376.1 hypothetical protein [Candidatus Krumholzibacteria bacterium]